MQFLCKRIAKYAKIACKRGRIYIRIAVSIRPLFILFCYRTFPFFICQILILRETISHFFCKATVAVGKQMERTEKFFLLATRVLAENGANIVKSYYCDGFERVAAACPVPIVIAGGKKLPEADALEMAYRAIQDGAHGVDMGRNIFQSDCPEGMAAAIGKVVHEHYTPQQALEVYQEIKHQKQADHL